MTRPSPRPRRASNTQALKDVFEWELTPQEFIIPHILPTRTTLLVSATPDVDARMLALFAAYCVAGGKDFLPFGAATASPVVYFSSKVDPLADWKRLGLIRRRDPFSSSQKRASKNLHYYNRHENGDKHAYLNSQYDQKWFSRVIPPGTRLVVIDNVDAFTKSGKMLDAIEGSDAHAFLEQLNAEGIAVMLIDANPKKGNPLSTAVMQGDAENVITLTYDQGAPHEFGGGFNIERQKRQDDDTTPRRFQFWWKVVKGQFDFGWELRKKLDPKASKKVEMLERQMKVDQLLSENKTQREIADLLEFDAATISRDMAKLKELAAERDASGETAGTE